MWLPVVLQTWVEPTINRVLALDPDSQRWLRPLAGKVIEICLMPGEYRIYLCPTATGIQLLDTYTGQVDTRLSGSPFAFMKMALIDTPTQVLLDGDIVLEGDEQTGQRLQRLMQKLDLDWEGLLARVSGKTAARQTVGLVQSGQDWLQESLHTFQLNLTEFLQEETRDLPAAPEAQQHYRAVDTLRNDSERLAARIARLRTHLDTHPNKLNS